MSIDNLLQMILPKRIKRIGFEDVKKMMPSSSISFQQNTCFINTLSSNEQSCLILGTISYLEEESTINHILEHQNSSSYRFVVYGKHCNDESSEKKCRQLLSFGCEHIYLYTGGLFEWLLLKDIYGKNEFPTTKQVIDILQYRPSPIMF